MRLKQPRIVPLRDDELTDEQREILAPLVEHGLVSNHFRTMTRVPKALRGFLAWGYYVLSGRNGLSPRDREIIILRIGFLCRSGYEWGQHVPVALKAGLTETEIARIKAGPAAQGWSSAEHALLQASDELHTDQFITDATWRALAEHYNEKQRMDVVFTAGQYTQVSMMLNTFGVQLDEGLTLDPDLTR